MWKAVAVTSVASLLLLAAAPSAVAFHGTPFRTIGTACLDGAPVCVPVALVWGGAAQFRLELVAPGVPHGAPWAIIPGFERFPQVRWGASDWCPASLELTTYVGMDSATQGQHFRVDGIQNNCLGDGHSRQIELVGHYQGVWHLTTSLFIRP